MEKNQHGLGGKAVKRQWLRICMYVSVSVWQDNQLRLHLSCTHGHEKKHTHSHPSLPCQYVWLHFGITEARIQDPVSTRDPLPIPPRGPSSQCPLSGRLTASNDKPNMFRGFYARLVAGHQKGYTYKRNTLKKY